MMTLPVFAAGALVVSPPAGISFMRVAEPHLERAYAIESAGYPEDEAATKEKLLLRIRDAPQYFYGAFEGSQLLGFVCGTLSTQEQLTEEAMSVHEPDGTTLCIHSVVVDEPWRRKGLATWMLQEYLAQVGEAGASRVLLICKEHLLGFYTKAGFANLGLSEIVHGQDPWFLCGLSTGKAA